MTMVTDALYFDLLKDAALRLVAQAAEQRALISDQQARIAVLKRDKDQLRADLAAALDAIRRNKSVGAWKAGVGTK